MQDIEDRVTTMRAIVVCREEDLEMETSGQRPRRERFVELARRFGGSMCRADEDRGEEDCNGPHQNPHGFCMQAHGRKKSLKR
jgi:hypothetical protein